MVQCPVCNREVKTAQINAHLDSSCQQFIAEQDGATTAATTTVAASASTTTSSSDRKHATPPQTQSNQYQQQQHQPPPSTNPLKRSAADFFASPVPKRQATAPIAAVPAPSTNGTSQTPARVVVGAKRSFEDGPGKQSPTSVATEASAQDDGGGRGHGNGDSNGTAKHEDKTSHAIAPVVKRHKPNRAPPLAERMRPSTLDDVYGQGLVGPGGVLRALIESDRLPSMLLWGGPGTGKTTIARCVASMVGSRFIELNATSTGVAECKKLFQEAANELSLTGRKTIIFCDEIHRFSKSQQDVFLRPVEAGTITLIGATTENPSFKVQAALLSRCRTFTLAKLSQENVQNILMRAVKQEAEVDSSKPLSPLIDQELINYLSAFADGDARTALNLLEVALSLTNRSSPPTTNGETPPLTKEDIKLALTKTLVYDRAGDQHYDTISAFHKSVRGSDPDAALYYLARMLQSGEDPLYVARRMVVIASEDVGLADNTLLPLATAAYAAAAQIGMPEARIPLAHCAVALCLAPKSTRAYRGLSNAYAALKEPGVAGLPIPVHLRNAPTRLMREMGYGAQYKYNPNYRDGQVKQDYLPEDLVGRRFLEDRDLGTEIDPDFDTVEFPMSA